MLLRGLPPQEAFGVAERLAQVSPADVAQMAQTYLAPDNASLVIVGDAKYFIEDLKALRGDVEVIPFDQLDLASVYLRKAASDGE